MMEPLIEDSLMDEEEMHSFRAGGDKNHRQANFSTSVFLTREDEESKCSGQKGETRATWAMVASKPTCICCV